MSEDAHTICPDCGKPVARVLQMPAIKIKAASESPQKSVERITKNKRQNFECPWVDSDTGKNKRIFRQSGEDKAAWKRRVQDTVLNTKMAKKRKLTRNDVQPFNT